MQSLWRVFALPPCWPPLPHAQQQDQGRPLTAHSRHCSSSTVHSVVVVKGGGWGGQKGVRGGMAGEGDDAESLGGRVRGSANRNTNTMWECSILPIHHASLRSFNKTRETGATHTVKHVCMSTAAAAAAHPMQLRMACSVRSSRCCMPDASCARHGYKYCCCGCCASASAAVSAAVTAAVAAALSSKADSMLVATPSSCRAFSMPPAAAASSAGRRSNTPGKRKGGQDRGRQCVCVCVVCG